MLKRFITENFLSFNKETILDLTAGRGEIHSNHFKKIKNIKILKGAIIYGANASGKSNLIKSVEYAKNIITQNKIDGFNRYFKFKKENSDRITKFEFELEIENSFFVYGFEIILNRRVIINEWLYKLTEKTEQMLFSRANNKIEFGNLLKNSKFKTNFEIYSNDIKNRESKLFLSELGEKRIETDDKLFKYINDVYNWFMNKLVIIYPDTKNKIDPNQDLDIYIKYLKDFDTDIIDIKEIDEDFEQFYKTLPTYVKKTIEDSFKYLALNPKSVKSLKMTLYKNGFPYTLERLENGTITVKKLILIHNKKQKTEFEFKEESDGTKRLFDLIPLITKFDKDHTILIDEFDRSLHPKLTKLFFEIFYSFKTSKTQLIATTHEVTLLDLNLVRRDEIFFVEKDNNSSSKLFSLSKFKERYDKKINKAYLLGRYGGVPRINALLDDNSKE